MHRSKILPQIINLKRRENNLITNLFTDYDKAFYCIQRQILFDILKSRNIPNTLLKTTVGIYTQNKILVYN